ncbi:mercury resistance system transport protein MerF [Candidatus Peregrinibacteria bacterium]|nr:mercury resistance system transport protein MerF [Candidatus Peregrinibacteria bacterium]
MSTEAAAGRHFHAAVLGTIAVAICCFTPILVLALGAAGLGIIAPYLDYVLLPALALLVLVTVLSYRTWKAHR